MFCSALWTVLCICTNLLFMSSCMFRLVKIQHPSSTEYSTYGSSALSVELLGLSVHKSSVTFIIFMMIFIWQFKLWFFYTSHFFLFCFYFYVGSLISRLISNNKMFPRQLVEYVTNNKVNNMWKVQWPCYSLCLHDGSISKGTSDLINWSNLRVPLTLPSCSHVSFKRNSPQGITEIFSRSDNLEKRLKRFVVEMCELLFLLGTTQLCGKCTEAGERMGQNDVMTTRLKSARNSLETSTGA